MFPALVNLIPCKADCPVNRKLKFNVVCVTAAICKLASQRVVGELSCNDK